MIEGSFFMKKILSIMMAFVMVLCYSCSVLAVDEYSFDLQYSGTIVKNIEKEAKVLLIGTEGTSYSNVQIKIDITGPAIPELLAIDSLGNEINIAQVGYWGPPSGFPVGGSFTNTTEIKATFPEEGDYTIKLSLVNVANGNAVITSKTFTLQVFEEEAPIVNNITNNTIEELPKTGTSIFDFLLYLLGLTLILSLVTIYLRARKQKV